MSTAHRVHLLERMARLMENQARRAFDYAIITALLEQRTPEEWEAP